MTAMHAAYRHSPLTINLFTRLSHYTVEFTETKMYTFPTQLSFAVCLRGSLLVPDEQTRNKWQHVQASIDTALHPGTTHPVHEHVG